jgi:8-oxo-dGTP pyrophosphatase MutT (NUDIX family)
MKLNNLKITHAGAVILRKRDSGFDILLTKRVNGIVPGFFLTQGHIEKKETPEAAAIREIQEETGISNVVLERDLGILARQGLEEDGKKYRKVIHFFQFQTEKINKDEWTIDSPDNKTFLLKFVPLKEAISYLYFKEEKELVSCLDFHFLPV